MLVLPDTFEIAVELGETNTPDMDSSEYSPVRPGSDPSELFGVRDYREGDALKRIHWKLSEKYDRTVVREASLPVARSILLLLDNAPEGAIAPEKVSAAVEGLMSASESLAGQGISHEIGWLNHETERSSCVAFLRWTIFLASRARFSLRARGSAPLCSSMKTAFFRR